jgi:hypothetical protein
MRGSLVAAMSSQTPRIWFQLSMMVFWLGFNSAGEKPSLYACPKWTAQERRPIALLPPIPINHVAVTPGQVNFALMQKSLDVVFSQGLTSKTTTVHTLKRLHSGSAALRKVTNIKRLRGLTVTAQ